LRYKKNKSQTKLGFYTVFGRKEENQEEKRTKRRESL